MKAVLFNAERLNFDGRLSFQPIEAVVDLVCYDCTDPDQAIARAAGCEILITKELYLHGLVEQLPSEVRLICEAGTGYNNIDLEAASKRNILVCNVPHYSTHAVAHVTVMFVLAMSTGLPRLIRDVEKGDRTDWARPSHFEASGKTLGVIGAGAIGGEVIRLARAMGMAVRVYSRSKRTWPDGGIRQVTLPELLAESHFVSLHVPLTDETRRLICTETLAQMRRGAYLINTGRGDLVEHHHLADALASGQLAGAALDVQDPEPLPDGHVLWSMDNVILTPHLGWKALESRHRLVVTVAENIRAFRENAPINAVNRSLLT
jgi:glycerate dehydrogenase